MSFIGPSVVILPTWHTGAASYPWIGYDMLAKWAINTFMARDERQSSVDFEGIDEWEIVRLLFQMDGLLRQRAERYV